ncbi:MAG: hypothetical protein AB7F96_17980 [Beijerinckiaceae bacterium]
MRKAFPTLEYYGWFARLLALLMGRVPAMAVAACLLLPLAQPQTDFHNNSKYVLTFAELDLDDADRPIEPMVLLAPATEPPRNVWTAGARLQLAADQLLLPQRPACLPPARGPPAAIS